MPNWEAYREAYQRGILPEDKKMLYEEAIKRGLVSQPETAEQFEQPQQSGFLRGMGIGTAAVAQGVAAIPLLVGDAANEIINYGIKGINYLAGTKIKQLKPSSQAFRDILTEIGLPEPQTGGERLMSDITRGGAEAMTMTGGAGLVTKGGAGLMRTLAESPIRQTIQGITAGGASGIAREAGAGPIGQTVAGVGTAAATGLITGVGGRVPTAEKGTAKVWSKAKTEEPALKKTIQANKMRSEQVESEIEGLGLNAAARSGDPNTLALQRSMQGVEAQTAARLNELQNTEAITNYVLKTIRGTGDPDEFLKKIQAVKDDIVTTREAAIKAVERTSTTMEPSSSIDVIGQSVRDLVLKKKSAESIRFAKIWEKIDQKTVLDPDPLLDKINEVFGSYEEYFSRVSSIPGRTMTRSAKPITPTPILDDAGNVVGMTKPDMTINQLAEFNKQITRDARGARAANDFELTGNLYKLKEGIENTVETAVKTGKGGTEAAKLKAFWTAYRDDFVPRFREGKTFDILMKKTTSEYSVSDIGVPAKYFAPGSKGIEGAKSFMTTFGQDSTAMQLIKDYATDDLMRFLRGSPKGFMNDTRFTAWKYRYSDALKAYGLKNQFDSLENALKSLGTATARQREFNKSILSKTIGVGADEAVASIMAGSNRIKNMRQVVGVLKKDPNAIAGLKTAIGDYFENKVHNFRQTLQDEKNLYSGAKVENFIRDNKTVLQMVYSPKEMAAYENVLTALKKMSLETYAAKQVGSPTKELFQTSMQFAGGYAPLNTKLRILRAALNTVSKPYRKAVHEILIEAIYNPEKALRLEDFSREFMQSRGMVGARNAIMKFVERQAIFQTAFQNYQEKIEQPQ